jgi:aspartate aminotransferase
MSVAGLSQRTQRIKVSPSSAASQKVRELKARGAEIVDLTIGEPDFDTPAHVKAAAIDAIGRGETKYTSVNGVPALREAIAAKIRRRTGFSVPTDRVTIGGGAKQIIFLALMASLDAGDEVIIPAPYWVSYPDMVLANDGKPVVVSCSANQQFKITADQLASAITPKTRWLILNTPGNPTGVAYDMAELSAIADVLRAHPHVEVLTDEIYDEVWFEEGQATSLLQVAPDLADRILLVNGVSKTYAMTGWRLGYAAGGARIIGAINMLQSQSSSCPSTISQFAAIAALTGPQDFVAEAAAAYRRRRDLAVNFLNAIPGINCLRPSGAFYLFPSCAALLGKSTPEGGRLADDQAFVLALLETSGVATIHGSAYGVPGHFRMSIATSERDIENGCRLIDKFCKSLE